MRTFGFPEFLFILEAAKWTIALSLIAFVGGVLGGLLVALIYLLLAMAFSALFRVIYRYALDYPDRR